MASLIDIRRRLKSVRNIQQITKAMKMIAAARLRRSQERVIAARPYARTLLEILANLAARAEGAELPLFAEREEKSVLLIIVAGDKGLAGAFNANISRAAGALLREKKWPAVSILPIGKKACDFWKRRKFPLVDPRPGIFSKLDYRHAAEIAATMTSGFLDGKFDAVYVVYNEFKSVLQQIVRVERLLPIPRPAASAAPAVDYLFEPSPAEILGRLLPRFVEFSVFKLLLESAAAENGARMTAMDSSTKNAGEMIDALTLTYNRARQARITKELIEIVSGAAALE